MVLGFNHNIRYKGELFHVQTEDSGRANPHIITLLYRGGTILASAKTSYADIIKVEELEAVVESIMKEQHKQMMRRLKAGEFDSRIFGGAAPQAPEAEQPPAASQPAPRPASAELPRTGQAGSIGPATDEPRPHLQPAPAAARQEAPFITSLPDRPAPAAQPAPAARPYSQPAPQPKASNPSPTTPPATPTKRSLDEVILDYLITGEEK